MWSIHRSEQRRGMDIYRMQSVIYFLKSNNNNHCETTTNIEKRTCQTSQNRLCLQTLAECETRSVTIGHPETTVATERLVQSTWCDFPMAQQTKKKKKRYVGRLVIGGRRGNTGNELTKTIAT